MQQSFKLIKCPHAQAASSVCLTHNCKSSSPFQCHTLTCKCHILHSRCKIMRIEALQDYLINWQKWIGKQCKDFMARVSKIYANAKDKLNREEKIFMEYCKDLFVGKDHTKVIFLLQKRQYSQLTSQLLGSSIKNITETSQPFSFEQFTLSQMSKIDEQIKNLTQTIQLLYKNKQTKKIQPQTLARSNSANLQRSNIRNKQQNQKYMQQSMKLNNNSLNQIIMLKIDLTYPKLINSYILQQATQLNKIISKKVKKYHTTYRATECDFSIAQFYRKHQIILLSLKQNMQRSNIKRELLSIILIKTEFKKIIGGFTLLDWQKSAFKQDTVDSQEDQMNPQKKNSSIGKFRPDYFSSTNLFSLDLMERYDLLKPQQAIYCGKKSIGFGRNDLRILEKANTNRKSYCKFPNSFNYSQQPYLNMSKSGMILSGSQYSPFFKIVEWEAFLAQI